MTALFLSLFALAADPLATAETALAAGRLADARTLLERQPGPEAAALLARTYLALKLPQPARDAARRAEQTGSAIPAVQHSLALYFAQSGQRKLAAQWEGRYSESPVADAGAALRATLLSAEVQDWPATIRYGEHAIARADRPDARQALARAYEASGQPAQAVEQHQAILQLLPYDEPAHAAYGQALLRMARFNDAAAFLAEARQKFDRSPQLELAYGVALYTQRRFAEASERFFRVIALAPDVPQPYIFLSRMIDQVPGRVPELLGRAEAWLRGETQNGFAPYVVARARQAQGTPDAETKPLLLEAIRRDERQWEFRFELGQWLERERDFAGAAAAYEKAVSLNARAPEVFYRLARMYDRLGQSAKAAAARATHQQLLAQPQPGAKPSGMQ